jgi:hypothetical protein
VAKKLWLKEVLMTEKIKQFLVEEANKNIIDYVKTVKKQYEFTNLTSMKSAFLIKNIEQPTNDQLRSFFKKLEEFNIGNLIREASTYKFQWKTPYSFVFLNKIINGDSVFIEQKNVKKHEVLEENKNVEIKQFLNKEINFLNHEFLLRPFVKITLILPDDFSNNEIDRVQSFLKTLPF